MRGIESYFYIKKHQKFLYCYQPSSCRLYYLDFYIDLITGEKVYTPIEELEEKIQKVEVSHTTSHPYVIHFFYELGYLWNGLRNLIPSNRPLAIEINYANYSFVSQNKFEKRGQKIELEAVEYPIFKEYASQFEKIYEHLLDGDCYQVNLTSQFYFKIKNEITPLDFLHALWRKSEDIGAYAHATYLHPLGKMFVSNSPECLFSLSNNQFDSTKIMTAPIKGTIALDNFAGDKTKAYQALVESKKDQAELYMIADLLRNDLAKIASTPAIIEKKKAPLFVPGLAHQYSLLSCFVDNDTSLLEVMRSLFPGGSITGAPKKRVMQIISKLENEPRSFYCGSTLLLHGSMKKASINIRSSEVDFLAKEVAYGAGGGITLNSHVQDEFDEVYVKMKSFIDILNN
jgi:para-aminobenzoate synthetase component 1